MLKAPMTQDRLSLSATRYLFYKTIVSRYGTFCPDGYTCNHYPFFPPQSIYIENRHRTVKSIVIVYIYNKLSVLFCSIYNACLKCHCQIVVFDHELYVFQYY